MKLAWLTDLHLNFVTDEDRRQVLIDEIQASRPDAVLVGGDTGEADSFAQLLERLATSLELPVYFVLGNHDYYKGSIAEVRSLAKRVAEQSRFLTWLPDAGVVALGERSALIGHGGWGDGRVGDFLNSSVVLNDYLLIDELRETHAFPDDPQILTPALLQLLKALGDEAAAHFREVLPKALRDRDKILVLMHVPPFHDACWHNGKLSDMNWAPHFVCQAVGEVLMEFMQQQPSKKMTVLCGHTHGGGEANVLANLLVLTGPAKYGHPAMQPLLTVE